MNDTLEPTFADLYLALLEFFVAWFVVSAVLGGLGAYSVGLSKLKRLIGTHRTGLREVRHRMRLGLLSAIWILLAATLVLLLCFLLAVTDSEAISNGTGPFGFLQGVATSTRYSAGTQETGTGNFIPWGCLLATFAGIVAGGYVGVWLGRNRACGSFDLTRQLY